MAFVVWKSVLEPTDAQEIMVPAGAEFLCSHGQFDQICVWFRCDPAAPEEPRTIVIVGTGHAVPGTDARYIGTAALHGGQLMFHVFERPAA